MFKRYELKLMAKNALKGNYWKGFAICAIVAAIPQLIYSVLFEITFAGGIKMSQVVMYAFESVMKNPINIDFLAQPVYIIAAGLLLLLICFDLFLNLPLVVGKVRFFIKSATENTPATQALEVFKSHCYLNVVRICFLKQLFLILWSLIYIIPFTLLTILILFFSLPEQFIYLSVFGFIPYMMKYYSYFMIEYIVSQDPEISFRSALSQSKDLTKGCRFEIFKLQFSFVGLFILGILLFGIGIFFVLPYYEATLSQLYITLKNQQTTDLSANLTEEII